MYAFVTHWLQPLQSVCLGRVIFRSSKQCRSTEQCHSHIILGLPCVAAASNGMFRTYASCSAQSSSPVYPTMTWFNCRYAPKYVEEYVGATNSGKYVEEYVGATNSGESLHLAEFWVDMRCVSLSHCPKLAVHHVTA